MNEDLNMYYNTCLVLIADPRILGNRRSLGIESLENSLIISGIYYTIILLN